MLKLIIRYAILVALILLASRWLDYSLFSRLLSFEVYVGILALLFTSFGIWMGLRLTSPRNSKEHIGTSDSSEFAFNQQSLDDFGISPREYEVLQRLAAGRSNQEIAEDLFISISTVKSHVSKLYEKLGVKRRTQAIQISQEKGLIP